MVELDELEMSTDMFIRGEISLEILCLCFCIKRWLALVMMYAESLRNRFEFV